VKLAATAGKVHMLREIPVRRAVARSLRRRGRWNRNGSPRAMTMRLISNSNDLARALRDHVMPPLRERGGLLPQRDVVRVIELRLDVWTFRHWTPFNDLAPEEAATPGHRHAVSRQHTRPDLPYGLDIRQQVLLLRTQWADRDAVDVTTFVRGDWEDELLKL